jgi:nitrogen fixation NifU-like protein
MEPINFNYWQDHSDHYLEMAHRTDRCERIERPDGYGKRTGDCGDTVEIYLSIKQGRIQAVSFQTDGCMNTSACANTVAELAEGKTVATAWEITPEDVIDYLETLPSQNFHCAELAVGALYLALADYREHQRQPWKKLYAGK